MTVEEGIAKLLCYTRNNALLHAFGHWTTLSSDSTLITVWISLPCWCPFWSSLQPQALHQQSNYVHFDEQQQTRFHVWECVMTAHLFLVWFRAGIFHTSGRIIMRRVKLWLHKCPWNSSLENRITHQNELLHSHILDIAHGIYSAWVRSNSNFMGRKTTTNTCCCPRKS